MLSASYIDFTPHRFYRKVFELRLFQSFSEARDHVAEYGFDRVETYILEKKMKENRLAAEIHLREGRYTTALKVLLRGQVCGDVQRLCIQYLLEGLWQFYSLRMLNKRHEEAQSLLRMMDNVVDVCSPDQHVRMMVCISMCLYSYIISYNAQFEVFKGITEPETAWLQLLQLAAELMSTFNDKSTSILCLDHVFNSKLDLRSVKAPSEVHDILQIFLAYLRFLKDAAYSPTSCHNRNVQYLLGFRMTKDDDSLVTVLPGTMLCKKIKTTDIGENISIRTSKFVPILRGVIREIIRSSTENINTMIRRCFVLRPCPAHHGNGFCPLRPCRNGHGLRDTINLDSFGMRIRVFLLHTMIFHVVEDLFERSERMNRRR